MNTKRPSPFAAVTAAVLTLALAGCSAPADDAAGPAGTGTAASRSAADGSATPEPAGPAGPAASAGSNDHATDSNEHTEDSGEHAAGSHMTRVRLYASVGELASDSTAVVVGTVTDQHSAADIDGVTDFTLSTVQVSRVVAGDVTQGGDVVVRQFGSAAQAAPTPLLEPGATYLLYLTASGLQGDLASQFYVTGGNAGLYRASGGSGKRALAGNFKQVDAQEGEQLPAELSVADAAG